MREIVKKLSEELNLPPEVVEKTYKAYWLFIRRTIEKLPLKEDLTEEEFKKLRTNFNLPYLGKLSCNYDRWLNIKNKGKYIKKKSDETKYKEDKTNV